jgi:hypothetical protein
MLHGGTAALVLLLRSSACVLTAGACTHTALLAADTAIDAAAVVAAVLCVQNL